MRNICSVHECSDKVVSNGLCDKHRLRLRNHGHLEQTRPKDWGKRSRHPLHGTWNWIKRKYPDQVGEWVDFWKFVEDVGEERPSPNHKLRRINESKPYSKENCKWLYLGTRANQSRADYAKQWRILNPEKAKDSSLRKMFGITYNDYKQMKEKQNCRCAICGNSETALNPRTQKPRDLAVDHCHKTGKIRGLLCTYCNTALGKFKDDITLLQGAIAYLERKKS